MPRGNRRLTGAAPPAPVDEPITAWASEAQMCAEFIKAVANNRNNGTWTVYPETGGWDILLVREDGVQVGIEAKLRLNDTVIMQALVGDGHWYEDGPDFRAVLVPSGKTGNELCRRIAAYTGITVITIELPSNEGFSRRPRMVSRFWPNLPYRTAYIDTDTDWFPWLPTRRLKLPEYVPDGEAGRPSPLQMTPWKVRAMKVVAILEAEGAVSRADFKHLQIDIRRWIAAGWLMPAEAGYIRTQACPRFESHHPRAYAEIKADIEKWRRPAAADAAKGF